MIKTPYNIYMYLLTVLKRLNGFKKTIMKIYLI